jgi:hypothetical protein
MPLTRDRDSGIRGGIPDGNHAGGFKLVKALLRPKNALWVIWVPQDLKHAKLSPEWGGRYVRTISYLRGATRSKNAAATRREEKRVTMNPGASMAKRSGMEVGTTWVISTREPDAVITSNMPQQVQSSRSRAGGCNGTDEPVTTQQLPGYRGEEESFMEEQGC